MYARCASRACIATGLLCAALSCGKSNDSSDRDDGSDDARHDAAADAAPNPSLYDRDALLDPKSCQGCHPGQYAEWAGSMHAYAAQDPVFIAMNARGQAETDGALGDFCVNCHAPMAVREGLTEDGLNLDELPDAYQGVTCYFCHNVADVEGVHNNPLVLANDTTMRGPFDDPDENSVHASAYSEYFDPAKPHASALCGACHDVTLPEALVGREVKLERTFAEWKTTIFNKPYADGGVGCNACHMPVSPLRDRTVADTGATTRRSVRHDFEGVDLALDAFPNKQRQRLLVERFLASSLLAEICVSELGAVEVTLENGGSGHNWPSGASHDREAWLEVRAFTDSDDSPVFETVAPEHPDEDAPRVVLKDYVVDAAGDPAHMFWDIAEVQSSTTLAGVATRDPLDPEFHREREIWTFDTGANQPIDLVTLKVRIRPIGLDILQDLVESGHLDQAIADEMPVLDVLPNRCYSPELIEEYSDILSARTRCDDEFASEFTLVWRNADANEDNRNYRPSRIDQVPARCLSHPTYVSVPQSP